MEQSAQWLLQGRWRKQLHQNRWLRCRQHVHQHGLLLVDDLLPTRVEHRQPVHRRGLLLVTDLL
jgi:hypothetical protein